jgi:hypothetical protein
MRLVSHAVKRVVGGSLVAGSALLLLAGGVLAPAPAASAAVARPAQAEAKAAGELGG